MKLMTLTAGLGVAALVATAAGAQTTGTTGTADKPAMATATFADAAGKMVGEAHLQQTPHGVLVKIDLTNATPGVHAVHVHKVGKCDAPSFESAGDHVALTASVHGFHNAKGPHTGDLPNLDVPSTKRLSVEHMLPGMTLDPGPKSLFDADGSALVIHAGKDDYATDPSGDSGDRIACARIAR